MGTLTLTLTYIGLVAISFGFVILVQLLANRLEPTSRGKDTVDIILLVVVWLLLITVYNNATRPQNDFDYYIELNPDYTVTVVDEDKGYVLDSIEQLEEYIISDNL